VPDLPQALIALAHEFEVASATHRYVADAQRELVALDAADDQTAALLQESGRITLLDLSGLLEDLQAAARRWSEQELLDPSAATQTLAMIEAALAARAGDLRAIRERHRAIGREISNRRESARRSGG